MSGDADDAALLAALLATLDGDSDGDDTSQSPAPVGSSVEGFPSLGGFSSSGSDGGAPRLLLEAGDAALDLLSPPLEFNCSAPVDGPATFGGLLLAPTACSISGSFHAAAPTIAATAPETDKKTGSCASAVAVRAQGKKTGVKRNYDPNKARNERMKEIQELRREVEELTDQVKAFRAMDDSDACADKNKRLADGSVSTPLAGAPPLWETICRNQLARRVHVERENARLKRALDEHVSITKSLQRLIDKSTKVQKTIGGLDACSTRRVYSLPSDSDADAEVFDRLVAEVDASYFEADGMFEINGVREFSDKPIRGRNLRDGEHGRFVDMFASDLLPFSVEATAEVVWDFYSGPNKHRGPLYYKTAKALELSKSTVVEKFAIELTANNTRADFRVWQVLRRYVDADRVLVVWMGVVEPIEFANKSFSGCGFREKGYVACSSAPVGGKGPDVPAFTRLQRCHRLTPYTTNAPGTRLSKRDKREIGAIIDFHLGLDSISVHLQMFQDELMQRSLRR